MLHRQVDRLAGAVVLARDRARHQVARSQFSRRLVASHEPFTGVVQQERPLATHGLRQQEPGRTWRTERRRVELNELEVSDPGAAVPRQGDTITGGDRRVGGLPEDLPGATGGNQHGGSFHRVGAAFIFVRGTHALAVPNQQAGHPRVALHADARLHGHLVPQRAANFTAGRVGRVHHAAEAMRALAAERELAGWFAIEARATGHQLARVAHAVFDQHANRRLQAQPITGRHGVGRMQVWRVARAQRRGDAALRVAGVALGGIGLGENEDVTGQRQIGGRAQSRDAAANDQEISTTNHERIVSGLGLGAWGLGLGVILATRHAAHPHRSHRRGRRVFRADR